MLVYPTFTLPFCTWMLMSYFRSIPVELEEAALIDGCRRLGVLFRIVLPLSAPALAVVALFSFTQAWNEFLYALVFTNSLASRTRHRRAGPDAGRGRLLLGPDDGRRPDHGDSAGDHVHAGPAPGDQRPGRSAASRADARFYDVWCTSASL